MILTLYSRSGTRLGVCGWVLPIVLSGSHVSGTGHFYWVLRKKNKCHGAAGKGFRALVVRLVAGDTDEAEGLRW